MFHHQGKHSQKTPTKALKDLTKIVASGQFLADKKRQALLSKMKEYSGLEASRYDNLCSLLIEHLVQYCQHLPETAHSYYSQPGGIVDHALNRTEAALSLFKEFMITDTPQTLSEEQKLWQYALYSAGLLQGIGKLFVDFQVNLYDLNGQQLKHWNPLLENLTSTGSYYDFAFQQEPEVDFRRRLNLLLAKALMPIHGFNWIASNPAVLATWLSLLNEDYRSAGTLGAILIRAQAISIQRYFADFALRSSAGRSGPFGRAGTFSGGTPESALDREQQAGIEFIQWIAKSIDNGRIMINKAPLLFVPGGMLMCAEMFQLFVREHPEYKNWQAMQKAIMSLGLHKRNASGPVTERSEDTLTNETYTGIVLEAFSVALPEKMQVFQAATGQTRTVSAVQFGSGSAATQLLKIDSKGHWKETASTDATLDVQTGARIK